jgi:hypothetical protein
MFDGEIPRLDVSIAGVGSVGEGAGIAGGCTAEGIKPIEVLEVIAVV